MVRDHFRVHVRVERSLYQLYIAQRWLIMKLPSGVPSIVCGIFEQAIELIWYFVADWHLMDCWNGLWRHLPLKIFRDF